MAEWKIVPFVEDGKGVVAIRKHPQVNLPLNERKLIYEDPSFRFEMLYHAPTRGVPKLLGYDATYAVEGLLGTFSLFNAFGVVYFQGDGPTQPQEQLDEHALRLLVYRSGEKANYFLVGRWRFPAVEEENGISA